MTTYVFPPFSPTSFPRIAPSSWVTKRLLPRYTT
jgi:hypothetical protein